MTANKPGSAQYAYPVAVAILGGMVATALVTSAVTNGSLTRIDDAVAFAALAAGILVAEWRVLAVGPTSKLGISLSTVFILLMLFQWTPAQTWLVHSLVLVLLRLSQRAPGHDDRWWLVGLKLAFNAGMYAIALVAATLIRHLVGIAFAAEAAGGVVFTTTTWLLCSVVLAQNFARPIGETVRRTWRLEARSGIVAALATPVALLAIRANLTLGCLAASAAALVGWIATRSRLDAEPASDLAPSAEAPPAGAPAEAIASAPADPPSSGLSAPGVVAPVGPGTRPAAAPDPTSCDAVTRSILLADIEGYSSRPDAVKARLRDQLNRSLPEAITASGIGADQHELRDEGDLFRAMIAPDIPKNRLLHPLVTELERQLDTYNASAPRRERIRLRVLVDTVDVRYDGRDYFGTALDEAYGTVNSPEARARLKQTPGSSLVLLVSRELYEAIVQQEYDGIDPASYEPITVTVKTRTLAVWARPPLPSDEPPPDAAEPDAAEQGG